MYTKETSLFSDAIINGTPVPVSPEDAVLDQAAVEAVYAAYESGKYIKL